MLSKIEIPPSKNTLRFSYCNGRNVTTSKRGRKFYKYQSKVLAFLMAWWPDHIPLPLSSPRGSYHPPQNLRSPQGISPHPRQDHQTNKDSCIWYNILDPRNTHTSPQIRQKVQTNNKKYHLKTCINATDNVTRMIAIESVSCMAPTETSNCRIDYRNFNQLCNLPLIF